MFFVEQDKTVHITRGDAAVFAVGAKRDGVAYTFQPGEVVRLCVYGKKNCTDVVLQRDVVVAEATERVNIMLSKEDTKIGKKVNKPVDYWYEVELNPDTYPQTIVGYDEDGAKIFKVYPEGMKAEV